MCEAEGAQLGVRTRRFGWLAVVVLGAAVLSPACASLPTVRTVQPSTRLDAAATADTTLGQHSARTLRDLETPSGLHLLPRGPEAFLARLAVVELAQRSLDLQYYIWQNDLVGRVLLAAIHRAADRGVRVRLLIDDVGSAARDQSLLMIDAHPDIEVRLFNPIATRSARALWIVSDFSRVNGRMHNKSLTADAQVTIVGGRNIGDEYFEASRTLDYGDLDAIAVGQAVTDVEARFDTYWNSASTYGITELRKTRPDAAERQRLLDALLAFEQDQRTRSYAQAMRDSPLAGEIRAGAVGYRPATVQVTADDPGKIATRGKDASMHLLPQLTPALGQSRERVILISPYFVPKAGGVARLRQLRQRGVRVQVLTNGLASTDVLPVFGKYKGYRRELLEAGVELFEVDPMAGQDGPAGSRQTVDRTASPGTKPPRAALHAKVLVFDCQRFFVGSMNLDPRSSLINTEIGLLSDAPLISAGLCAEFESTVAAGAFALALDKGPDGRTRMVWTRRDGATDLTFTAEPRASRWQRFKAWCFGVLPIESQM